MDNLCSHLRGLCLEMNFLKEIHLKRFIGKLNSIADTSTYVEMCKELAHILMKREADQFDEMFIDMELNPYWAHKESSWGLNLITYSGDSVRISRRYKDPFLNALVTMDPRDPRTHKVWVGLMRLQTGRDGVEPSRSERDEIYKSISHHPFRGIDLPVWDKRNLGQVVENILYSLVRHVNKRRLYLPLFACPSTDKSSFIVDSSGRGFPKPRTDMRHYIPNNALRIPEILELYEADPEEFIAAGFTGVNVPGSFIIFDDEPMLPRDLPLGNITSINERGNKHRVVASPMLLINNLGFPLAKVITDLNQVWPCQGFDSHENTVNYIQRLLAKSWSAPLNKRLTFHSIDMKSFTDYLPYRGFQRRILNTMIEFGLITEFDLKVMDLICSMKFRFLDTSKSVSYGTGTPMGSYPSFPLATFANGVMLAYASLRCGYTDIMDLPGKVIGDDIVIWDNGVAESYRSLAKDLGLIISEDKSIVSQHVCEMCSKVILPSGVYEKKKLKESLSPGAILKDIEYYGLSFVQNLNKEYKHLVDYLMQVPKPSGLGRGMEAIMSDLDLCAKIDLESGLLITPIEMYFFLSHLENAVEKYIDTPLDKGSIHLMRRRLKYYPNIIIGTIPKSDISDTGSSYLGPRDVLRHQMKLDLSHLRLNRRKRKLMSLDGSEIFPNPTEIKTLANIAKDVKFLNEQALSACQRLGTKPIQIPKEFDRDSEPEDSVHRDPFHFYEGRLKL